MALQLGQGISGPAAPRGTLPALGNNSVLNSILRGAAAGAALGSNSVLNRGAAAGAALGSSPPKTTVAPVAAPSAPASTNGYTQQLADDQLLQQQLAAINTQGTANAAQLTAQQRAAIVQYGQVPDSINPTLEGDVNGAIDQTTRDLANQATQGGVSTVAQLQKAYQNQQAADNASLAARGMIQSGALGQHANQDLTAYQQSQYSAAEAILNALTGYYQNYLGTQQQLQGTADTDTNDALQRIIAQINASVPSGGGDQTSVDQTSGDYSDQGTPDPGFSPGSTIAVNQPTAPYYGVTTGPPAGQRASSNARQGHYTVH